MSGGELGRIGRSRGLIGSAWPCMGGSKIKELPYTSGGVDR